MTLSVASGQNMDDNREAGHTHRGGKKSVDQVYYGNTLPLNITIINN